MNEETQQKEIILIHNDFINDNNIDNIVEEKEVKKMAESQSRYSIMEELNNRKINEKEKLANIERETDKKTYEIDEEIQSMKDMVSSKEKTYETEHRKKIRELEVSLKMLNSDFLAQQKSLNDALTDENTNYKQRHLDWKTNMNELIDRKNKELKKYEHEQKQKINVKKDIIKEIDGGINSLKEMSKEQTMDK